MSFPSKLEVSRPPNPGNEKNVTICELFSVITFKIPYLHQEKV